MSACTCPGKRKHTIAQGDLRSLWRVLEFPSECYEDGGFGFKPNRSTTRTQVVCLRCLKRWRTDADYVSQLRPASDRESADVAAGVKRDGHLERDRARAAIATEEAAPVAARYTPPDYKMLAAGEA